MPEYPFILSATATVGAALYQGLVLRCYAIPTSKWMRGAFLRFAVVSDLHSTLFGQGQRDILGLLQRIQPNHILLAGDIVDEHRPPSNAHAFLKGAARIAPSWYALGNHEYRTRCVPAVVRMAQRCGVAVLLDTAAHVSTPAGPLVVAGCEDPEKTRCLYPVQHWENTLHQHFAWMGESSAFTVLIAHRPEHSGLYSRLGVDMAVSGHAHGGQVRVPLVVNGLFAPDQGLFPRHAGGCYRHGRTSHIVSRGVVTYKRVPRVFNPPEIAVVDIVGTAEDSTVGRLRQAR